MSRYLFQMIEKGESEQLDFKHSISDPSKIAKTLSAFANGKGGSLLIGINDQKHITGVRADEEKYMVDLAAKFYCKPVPEIEYREWVAEHKVILECKVLPVQNPPCYARDDEDNWSAYVRVNDQTLHAGKVALGVMKRKNSDQGSLIQFNEAERILLEQLALGREITINEFCKMAKVNRWKAIRILINLVSTGIIRLNRNEKFEYFTSL
ncbi:MAG: ATP-binding protein [Bacteroidetes bacterium]|nr:ATP-binding protein [Bacteroidota bacterium]